MSRWDKLLMFGGLNAAAVVLFIVCFTLFPVLALKPTKFAIMYVLRATPCVTPLRVPCRAVKPANICTDGRWRHFCFSALGRSSWVRGFTVRSRLCCSVQPSIANPVHSPASPLQRAGAVHGHLLWQHRPDFVLCAWGRCSFIDCNHATSIIH